MHRTIIVLALLVTAGLVRAVPLQEPFTGTVFPPEMWTVYNEDGGSRQWVRSLIKYRTTPGCAGVGTESRRLRNDDWLITRRIMPVPGDDELTFWARSHNRVKVESLELWVSTGGWEVGDFVHSLGGMSIGSGSYLHQTISLAQFDSMPVYVAFRSCALGQRTLYVDDVAGPQYVPDDVGAFGLVAPYAYEPPDTNVFPAVRVKNYGSAWQGGFEVRVAITDTATGDTVYRGSATVDSLDPQETAEVVLPTAWLTALGTFRVTARAVLPGDMEPRNDSFVRYCSVVGGAIHDVAAVAIVAPGGLIPAGPVVPQVEVENLGNVAETFPVVFDIRSGPNPDYVDTVEVTAPIHDVGVLEVLAPVDTVVESDSVMPEAVVVNYGDYDENSLVTFQIGAGYTDTLRLDLVAGTADTARFRQWTAGPTGELPVSCFTELPGDEDPANDTAATTVFVDPLQGQAEERVATPAAALSVQTVSSSRTAVELAAPAGVHVELCFFDACGNRVARYRFRGSGRAQSLAWTPPSAGVYLLRADIGGRSLVRKLVLY